MLPQENFDFRLCKGASETTFDQFSSFMQGPQVDENCDRITWKLSENDLRIFLEQKELSLKTQTRTCTYVIMHLLPMYVVCILYQLAAMAETFKERATPHPASPK